MLLSLWPPVIPTQLWHPEETEMLGFPIILKQQHTVQMVSEIRGLNPNCSSMHVNRE